jgi:hypothetical protein
MLGTCDVLYDPLMVNWHGMLNHILSLLILTGTVRLSLLNVLGSCIETSIISLLQYLLILFPPFHYVIELLINSLVVFRLLAQRLQSSSIIALFSLLISWLYAASYVYCSIHLWNLSISAPTLGANA